MLGALDPWEVAWATRLRGSEVHTHSSNVATFAACHRSWVYTMRARVRMPRIWGNTDYGPALSAVIGCDDIVQEACGVCSRASRWVVRHSWFYLRTYHVCTVRANKYLQKKELGMSSGLGMGASPSKRGLIFQELQQRNAMVNRECSTMPRALASYDAVPTKHAVMRFAGLCDCLLPVDIHLAHEHHSKCLASGLSSVAAASGCVRISNHRSMLILTQRAPHLEPQRKS